MGQMPPYLYWFRCIMRFWRSLTSTNNAILSQAVQADLPLADKEGTRTYWVLTALDDVPNAQQFAAAMRTRAKINVNDLEGVLCEHIIHDWRSPNNLTPQEAHASSRFMRTYHTLLANHWALYRAGGMKKEAEQKASATPLPTTRQLPSFKTLCLMLMPFQTQALCGNPTASWKH
eukprot:1138712-Pelagomonas_calceolata.AAC.1